ncbi:MAG: 6,7-dimethyl-8-ribityllumazine synthase [Muribaculaceae bacterium]|nr:6,7-dimethyl-8-ribityllumazine synthase [Muribaculaceae bacterium]
MSTILNTNGVELKVPVPVDPEKFTCVVLTADWNPAVTHALRDGALEVMRKAGVPQGNVLSLPVPGTVELVYGAARAARELSPSAIIVIGCVIRGDTPHFDYVCQQAAQGVATLNAAGEVPVIFGVLTVDNLRQALDRAGGTLGNKGAEAAAAAIEMANLTSDLASSTLPGA